MPSLHKAAIMGIRRDTVKQMNVNENISSEIVDVSRL